MTLLFMKGVGGYNARQNMIETRRLYYDNVYTKEFKATVLECRRAKKGFHILLDQTAFYPEGGGQPSDVGTLDQVKVTEVHEKDGELLHYTQEAIEAGSTVCGRIDWDHRFDLMQQHSGEHMVSGIIHELYGYDNVGFHMGRDVITIDLSGMLDEAQLSDIEDRVNRKIWENIPVEITYPSRDDLKTLEYRSKKEIDGQVRIVTFPGCDTCACCGTHVTHTGEIGMVKLLSAVRFHQGVRIEMICGKRVLDYLNMINAQNHEISVELSARMSKTAEAVRRLHAENTEAKAILYRMEEETIAREADAHAGEENVLIFKNGMSSDGIRKLTDAVLCQCSGRCAVFSDNGDGTYKYAMGERDGDLRALTKEMNQALNGRGGGKPFFVQGSVKASKEEIEAFWYVH